MSEFRPAPKTPANVVSGSESIPNSAASLSQTGEFRRSAGSAGRRAREIAADAQRQLLDALAPLPESPLADAKAPQAPAAASARLRRRERDEDDTLQTSLDFTPIEPLAAVESSQPVEAPVLLAQAADAAAAQAAGSGAAAGSSGAAAAGAAAGLSAPVIGGMVIGAGVLIANSNSSSAAAAPAPAAPAPDTTPPVLVSTAVSSSAGTVTLTFDSALDTKAPPARTAFKVAINGGAEESPDSITVEGSKVVLKFAAGVIPAGNITIALSYTDKTAGDDALALQDEAGNDVASFSISQGVVADGYIRGAQIYVDSNNNGIADASEKITGVVTDSAGRFFLPSTAPKGAIIAVGGVNIDTGLPNTAPLKAPAGSTTINPLTTLVQAVIEKSGSTAPSQATIQAAANQVAKTLGLPESVAAGGNLLNYDPLSVKSDASADDKAAALAVQKAAAKVATVVALAASDAGAAGKVVANLASSIQDAGGQTLKLDDGNVLAGALKGVNVSVETRVAVADAVSAINTTSSIAGISNVQSQVLDKIAPDKPVVSVSARASTATPTVKVTLNTESTDGTAAVVGDIVRVLEGGVQIASATITEADLAAKQVSVAINSLFPLSEGSHTLQAQVVDKSGNVSPLSAGAAVVVDLTLPKALISNSVGAMVPGGKSVLTVSLSESVENFSKDDILIPSGSSLGVLSAPTVLANGQVVYTIDFTAPTAQGAIKVSVGTAYADLAGNAPGAGSPELDLSIDADPTAVILDNISGIATGPVTYTISFSERVNGFDLSDLTVTGGAAGSLVTVSANQVYSFVVTPEANASNIAVQLKAGAVTDVPVTGTQGKTNAAVTAAAQPVDVKAPTITIGQVAGDDKINAAEFKTILDAVQGSEILVSGTSDEAGVRVSLQLGAGNVRSVAIPANAVAVDGKFSWSYALTPADIKAMGQGAETIIARGTDAAGNTTSEAAAATRSISIGSIVPTLTAWSLTDASDSGVKGDGRTNVASPSISFAASKDLAVSVQVLNAASNAVVKSYNAVGTGSDQTLVLDGALSEAVGSFAVKLTATDVAGGNSVERSGQLVYDATGPSAVASDTTAAALVGRAAGDIVFRFVGSEPVLGLTADEVTIVGGKAAGAVKLVGANTFELAVTPDANLEGDTAGRVTVSVAAGKFTDLAGNPNTAVSAHYQAVDTRNPQVGTLPTASLNENDSAASFTFTASDGNGVVWSIKPGVGDASLVSINSSTGVAKLNAPANFEAKSSYDFTVVATDGAGNVTETQFKPLVRNLDEVAPSITSSGTGSIPENEPISRVAYQVTSTDTGDTSTGSTSYSIKPSVGDASLFTINSGTGEVRLAASANFEVKPNYTITVVATDAAGNFSEKPITIAVTDVNERPVVSQQAPTDPLIVVVNQALSDASVSGWFSDPDGVSTNFGKLTYSATGLPTTLSLNSATGQVTGTVGTAGDGVVTFTATDGGGLAVNHVVTVRAVVAPVIQSFTAADTLGATTTGKQGDTITLVATLSEGVVVTGTPKLSLTVGAGTTPFVATYASGSDTNSLTFTGTVPAGNGTLKITGLDLTGATVTGKISKQPIVTAISLPSESYKVDNTAPSVTTTSLSVEEGLTAVGQLASSESGVSYTLGSGGNSSLFSVSPSSSALTLLQAKDYEADPRSYTVSVTPTDAAGNVGQPATITVSLTDKNEFPVTTPSDSNAAANTVAENSAAGVVVGVTGSASDADGTTNKVTYSLVTSTGAAYTAGEFAIDANTGVVTTGATALNFETGATRTIYIKATSEDGSSKFSAAIDVAVTNVNEAPVQAGSVGAQTAVNGQPFTLDLKTKFADPDASGTPFGTLTYTITPSALPSGLIFNAGSISGTATANAAASNFTVTATDGGNLTATQSFSLQVVSAPVVNSFTVVDAVGATTAGKAGDALTFTVRFTEAVNVTGTPKFYFNVVDAGQVASSVETSYVSGTGTDALVFSGVAPSASGTFALQQILLGTGASVVGKVTSQPLVTSSVGQAFAGYTLDSVAPVITSPVGTAVSVPENTTKIADLTAGETVTWSLAGATASQFSVNNNVLSFTAPRNFEVSSEASASVTLVATDAVGNQTSRALTISVTNVNEAPTFAATTASLSVAENTAAVSNAAATDPDAGTTLTYSIGGTDASKFNINTSTGALSFKAAPNFEVDAKTYSVTVTATDGGNLSATQTVSVSVSDVNEAPTVVAGSPTSYVAVVSQQLSNASIAGWFRDEDAGSNGELTYALKAGSVLPAGLSLAADGAVTGTPTTVGTVSVTFVAKDGGNLTVEKTVSLNAVSAPTLNASPLDNVTNLEPGSNIVLTFSEGVNPVAGKFIKIVNDANGTGAAGFRGEAATNTLQIDATSSQITFSTDKRTVVINPTADLDLANNYHIEFDAGAFVGVTSLQGVAAYNGATTLNFSTVTPKTPMSSSAPSADDGAASQSMGDSGSLTAGRFWLDVEGLGTATTKASIDLSGKSVALVAKDYDPGGPDPIGGYDGIRTGDIALAVVGFSKDDLLYFDNQSAVQNDLGLAGISNEGSAPTTFQFAGTNFGGFFDITVAGSSAAFETVDGFKLLLTASSAPVISA